MIIDFLCLIVQFLSIIFVNTQVELRNVNHINFQGGQNINEF